jgi:hypothetical protein
MKSVTKSEFGQTMMRFSSLHGFFLHHQLARNQNKPSGSELHESGLQKRN